jgi:hypothetical protein
MCTLRTKLAQIAVAGAVSFLGACGGHPEAVTTYHYNNLRTGWNAHEEKLTRANVHSARFGLRHTVTLDDQVDTQPLVMPRERITAGSDPGKHDVVYVATEGNTIYAIDAHTGAILLSPNFGPPVPMPLGCGNNGPNVGIDGTPVIDREDNTMYAIVYTLNAGTPEYYIHELDLSNLTDKIPPVLVSALYTLTDHSTFHFNATYQRQRPALVESKGKIYAGFGSFCDWGGDQSRGWILGWEKGSLTPLAANHLNDTQATSIYPLFLSSLWMSGYGISADDEGHLYFITGNSDYWTPPGPTTYDGVTNIQESVVKMAPDLTKIDDLFTPSNVRDLDSGDTDYGSGGPLLLPFQEGSIHHVAAAAGKDGRMFLLNRDNMGGYTPGGPDKVVGLVNIGGCWCGQSYFSDGEGHVVSSGGSNVIVWKVVKSPSFQLMKEATSAGIGGSQDPGFFTSISSDESHDSIIWAVSRPDNPSPATVSLFAFEALPSGGGSTLNTLFQGDAGTWPNVGGNANIVPVVANGKVYVASYKQLSIFGLN